MLPLSSSSSRSSSHVEMADRRPPSDGASKNDHNKCINPSQTGGGGGGGGGNREPQRDDDDETIEAKSVHPSSSKVRITECQSD